LETIVPIEDHDDLDARFDAIVAQFDRPGDDQAARMRAVARRVARRPRRRRVAALWVIILALLAAIAMATLVALRPALLSGAPASVSGDGRSSAL
jgi:hypothetical protein